MNVVRSARSARCILEFSSTSNAMQMGFHLGLPSPRSTNKHSSLGESSAARNVWSCRLSEQGANCEEEDLDGGDRRHVCVAGRCPSAIDVHPQADQSRLLFW